MKASARVFALTLLTTFALALGARAADATSFGTPAGSIELTEGATIDEVQHQILEAAVGRGWTIASQDREKVVVTLTQDTWTARLTLVYTTHDVQIYSQSTRKGKPKLPETWIRFLKQDITTKHNLALFAKKPTP